ncbi:hypothetical protein BH11BAC5_BH11BAC5_10790 [soil metagenome]
MKLVKWLFFRLESPPRNFPGESLHKLLKSATSKTCRTPTDSAGYTHYRRIVHKQFDSAFLIGRRVLRLVKIVRHQVQRRDLEVLKLQDCSRGRCLHLKQRLAYTTKSNLTNFCNICVALAARRWYVNFSAGCTMLA